MEIRTCPGSMAQISADLSYFLNSPLEASYWLPYGPHRWIWLKSAKPDKPDKHDGLRSLLNSLISV